VCTLVKPISMKSYHTKLVHSLSKLLRKSIAEHLQNKSRRKFITDTFKVGVGLSLTSPFLESSATSSHNIVIKSGGISGLNCAYLLQKKG
jgi:hypothetical protein